MRSKGRATEKKSSGSSLAKEETPRKEKHTKTNKASWYFKRYDKRRRATCEAFFFSFAKEGTLLGRLIQIFLVLFEKRSMRSFYFFLRIKDTTLRFLCPLSSWYFFNKPVSYAQPLSFPAHTKTNKGYSILCAAFIFSCAYKNHQGKASQEVCEAWLRIGHYAQPSF